MFYFAISSNFAFLDSDSEETWFLVQPGGPLHQGICQCPASWYPTFSSSSENTITRAMAGLVTSALAPKPRVDTSVKCFKLRRRGTRARATELPAVTVTGRGPVWTKSSELSEPRPLQTLTHPERLTATKTWLAGPEVLSRKPFSGCPGCFQVETRASTF